MKANFSKIAKSVGRLFNREAAITPYKNHFQITLIDKNDNIELLEIKKRGANIIWNEKDTRECIMKSLRETHIEYFL